ncbi:MAG: NAD-dependent deacylase [Eubacteriales bacterium]|nr:NAD-dependent deacylase [Bacillota bacterium]MBV1727205.1 NAD-dependent deacylase [Desulforudis sp.]MDP3051562.1 NAD-dependent deacylase [Eubacteriales bacterium]MDQ7789770.1 NAD-dependent deacylase [Clostridia bacterium]MBU4553577.1 NAD-dependent deacylase [Bacillota bacterium]
MNFNARIGKLADLLRASDRTFALTGAGISTESGIPDFRTRGSGLWEKADPAEVCSIAAFHRNPSAFWRNNMQWWQGFCAAEPNVGHHALAGLQKAGLLFGVITQNIDGLHRRAGSTVWEVHGHLRTVHCLQCDRREPFAIIEKWITGGEGEEAPRCNCGSLLRPDVVLFGDQMSPDFWVATQVLSGCQLLLVVGSSLQVYPVAGLPQLARDLVIINRDPTPYDNQAQLVIRESIGTVFKELLDEMGL